jgi:putative transposase
MAKLRLMQLEADLKETAMERDFLKKAKRFCRIKNRYFRFIQKNLYQYKITWMCNYFGVSKSGFYSWKKRAKSKKVDRVNTLLSKIKRAHRGQRKFYASPRVCRALRKKCVV